MSREPFNPYLIQPPPESRPAAVGAVPLTVSQLTALVKQAIETALPATIHVVGEISNFKRHSSRHLYFTLKDSASELSCVMWRSAAEQLKFTPDDGLEVIATGTVELFERAGRYQLYVRRLDPRGVGALELAFRQLCEKLAKEGLFDAARKRPVAAHPERIAVVTSPTGAAITDILRTIERRYPCVHVLIYPVRVQGEGAAAEISSAISWINANHERFGGVNVMIVGRGGGSLEDLWAFNEEVLARAIHASGIPIVSAVGHEVDITIADLVADVRAATPTAAAELVVPVLEEIRGDLDARYSRLNRAIITRGQWLLEKWNGLRQRRAFREPSSWVRHREQAVDEWTNRLTQRLWTKLRNHRRLLDRLEPVVRRIAPHLFLLRLNVALTSAVRRIDRAMSQCTTATDRSLQHLAMVVQSVSPIQLLTGGRQRLNSSTHSLHRAAQHRLALLGERLRTCEQRLHAVGYESVLARGFSVTRTKKGRRVVRSVSELCDRDRVTSQLADGEFESEVVNRKQLELFE